MSAFVIFSPAKLNLFLAVTGRRADGFHDLVSLVAPVAWGDHLRIEPATEFSLVCNDPAVPLDESNLILKAALAFRAATGWTGGARFILDKQIPLGAGLGGGSSNATAALLGLNQLSGRNLNTEQLAHLAAQIGSDCVLFLYQCPVVMRGRGERVEPLPPEGAGRLSGRRVLIFKPSFGVATPWAYGRLAAQAAAASTDEPKVYLPPAEAESRLATWLAEADQPVEAVLFNSLERPAFEKFVALPALLSLLQTEFKLQPRMSGSGSACFAFLPASCSVDPIMAAIRAAWGPDVLLVVTHLI